MEREVNTNYREKKQSYKIVATQVIGEIRIASKMSCIKQNKTDQCIFGCENVYALHGFPDPRLNFDLFMKWKKALKHVITEDNPHIIFKQYKICHDHFTNEMKWKRYLLRTAVPSVNLKGSHVTVRNETQRDKTETLKNNSESQSVYFSKGLEANDYSAVIIFSDDKLFDEDNLKGKKVELQKRTARDGYFCNICEDLIVGSRYTCVECIDFDLCNTCEAKGSHSSHYVLRIPQSKLDMDLRELLGKIRTLLLKRSPTDLHTSHTDIRTSANEEFEPIFVGVKEAAEQDFDDECILEETVCSSPTIEILNFQLDKSPEKENVSTSREEKEEEFLSYELFTDLPKGKLSDHKSCTQDGGGRGDSQNGRLAYCQTSRLKGPVPEQHKPLPKIIICKSKLIRKAKFRKVRVVLTRLTQEEIDSWTRHKKPSEINHFNT